MLISLPIFHNAHGRSMQKWEGTQERFAFSLFFFCVCLFCVVFYRDPFEIFTFILRRTSFEVVEDSLIANH